jgi:hypothetical protein
MTNGEWLKQQSETLGIPSRTLAQVKEALEKAKRKNADMAMARLMAKHGRLEADAMAYVQAYVA